MVGALKPRANAIGDRFPNRDQDNRLNSKMPGSNLESNARSNMKMCVPIVLGAAFWIVIAVYWLFLFRRPEEFTGSFLELGVFLIAGLVPAYIGTVVGFIMSIYSLRAAQGRSWHARIGLVLCSSASVGLVIVFLYLAMGPVR